MKEKKRTLEMLNNPAEEMEQADLRLTYHEVNGLLYPDLEIPEEEQIRTQWMRYNITLLPTPTPEVTGPVSEDTPYVEPDRKSVV